MIAAPFRITLAAIGVLLLVLSRLLAGLRPDHAELYTLWAMLGLVLAALPVLIDGVLSLKAEGFEATRYYMDQFVALAVLACFATGEYATGVLVAAILIIGQIMEERATLGVEEAIASLTCLTRVKARLSRDGSEESVDAHTLRSGDIIRLLPGDTVPADAQVTSGSTTLDQSSITGESLPVEATAGNHIFAGTINLTGSIIARIEKTGPDTVLGRVSHIVEEAKTSRAPVMRLIDEYTRYYMPLVLMLAGFVLFFTHDVQRAITILIVAMPCAFVLASPSAMIAALAVASRMGILIKSSRHIETAARIDTIVFDKTGTLTTGHLQVTALHPAADIREHDLLAAAAALEAHSTHPIARAILAEAEKRGLKATHIEHITETPGLGISGASLIAGRRSFLAQNHIAMPDEPDPADASVLHLAQDNRYLGRIHLADTARPEAPQTLTLLRAIGITDIIMLTGDTAAAAQTIAQAVSIHRHHAQCLPEQKLAEVRRLKDHGHHVLVIGDGVNDAPALAAGHLGIAMGAHGSDVAIQTADIALMGHDLRALPALLRLSEHTLAITQQNLLWGLAFILIFITLSALGLISPITAAVLHEVSASFVIFNSARLLRFDPGLHIH